MVGLLCLAACDAQPQHVREVGPRAARGTARVVRGGHDPARSLDVRIKLNATIIRAGHVVSGTAIISNIVGHPLLIAACNGTWLQVGLTNAKIAYDPFWTACLSSPGTTVPVGTTHIPIKVQTAYSQCTGDARSVTVQTPACLNTRHGTPMPPLPPGRYMTKAVMLSPAGMRGTTQKQVPIILTS